MKKSLYLIGLVLALTAICPRLAAAAVYDFVPNPADLYDLDHYKYYTWGIEWAPAAGEEITQVTLTIDNINNWQRETDILYVHLLNDAQKGVRTYTDNQRGGDNLASWASGQILLDTYTDLNDYPGPAEDYVYDFTGADITTLNAYLANGLFGLGFDPDCHYYNDGVKLSVTTASNTVPEPATLLLMASGLLGGLRLRRRA